jgi:hypothetical protein
MRHILGVGFGPMPLSRLAVAPLAAALLFALLFALPAAPAAAQLVIDIDKRTQTMTVSRDGALLHRWPVSTGTRRHDTPVGRYTPFRLEEDHFSREWDNAPMPHSIFFTKRGHAIHGTTHLDAIGVPASRGCVRLEPENARLLFDMVKREGLPNVRIALRGDTPPANAPWLVRRAKPKPDMREAARQGPERQDRQDSPQAQPERGFFGRSPLPRPNLARTRPGYIGPNEVESDIRSDAAPAPPPVVGAFGPAPWERPAPEFEADARSGGYWLVRPDGSRVFVDRERAFRPPPPPPPPLFFGGARPF